MSSIYGHKWSSQYGDSDADDTWAIGLLGITPRQIAQGLRHAIAISADRVKTGDEDWPPTLGEFRAYCEPVAYPYRGTLPALPKSNISREEQQKYLDECKRILGKDLPWTHPLKTEREPGEEG